MIANYHTHTWRCNHAQDTEREYVERAIEGGLKVLGFSDHTPYPHISFKNKVRMQMNQFDDYADTVLALKKEYAGDIALHLGAEVEYYPHYFDELMRFFEGYPMEYMLLGQHFLEDEIGAQYSGTQTDNPDHLIRYVDQCIEGMQTGRFLYIAHPDLLNFQGDMEVYNREYSRLCRAAKEYNLPLEINFVGIRYNRWYPREDFWKLAKENGNTVIFGFDAHCARDACDRASEEKALEIVKKYDLNLIAKMELGEK